MSMVQGTRNEVVQRHIITALLIHRTPGLMSKKSLHLSSCFLTLMLHARTNLVVGVTPHQYNNTMLHARTNVVVGVTPHQHNNISHAPSSKPRRSPRWYNPFLVVLQGQMMVIKNLHVRGMQWHGNVTC
jgi:hypothetical protein